MYGKLGSGEGWCTGSNQRRPKGGDYARLPSMAPCGENRAWSPGPRRGTQEAAVPSYCRAAKAAAAATVAVVRAVAAPPLSTRDAPHSPRQGPGAANHSGARGEAPPPPGTSATSEEGERGEDAEGKDPGLAALPPSLGRPSVGVASASGPRERCS